YIAVIEQGQSDKNEKDVCTKDVQRRFTQGEKWLYGYESEHILAHPVEDDRECDEVNDSQGADLPFIELHAQGLLRKVRAEPFMANANEEKTHDRACGDDVTGNAPEGNIAYGGLRADPHSGNPDSLPCKKIERASLLQRNGQMCEVNNDVVHDI